MNKYISCHSEFHKKLIIQIYNLLSQTVKKSCELKKEYFCLLSDESVTIGLEHKITGKHNHLLFIFSFILVHLLALTQ